MAKVSAPLLSFEARGKIADALVYFPWKGIAAVRKYVIPANPQTAAQTTQRGYMTAAMTEWHGADYTALDVTAWNRFAGTLAKIMAGVNAFCRTFINEAILTNTWERSYNVETGGVGANAFDVNVHVLPGAPLGTVYYGTRKTHFPDSVAMEDVGGNQRGKGLSGLIADTLYYFYMSFGTPGTDYGRTGIYQQRTTA